MSSPLRDRFTRYMVLRGFAPKTQEAYLRAVIDLSRYYGRSPDQLNNDQIQEFLHKELIESRKRSWSTVNVYFSAFRCFYLKVLEWDQARFTIPPRVGRHRKPVVLSPQEVKRLLGAAGNAKHRALLCTAYGAGLRVSELVNLKPEHIESSPDRMMIRVEQGKGHKDRYTVLFDWVLEALREYWREFHPSFWLFPGEDPRRPLVPNTALQVYKRACLRAGLGSRRGIHTLRHCFATHLLASGVDIYTVKRLLGHVSLSTTAGYLHVSTVQQCPLSNPLI